MNAGVHYTIINSYLFLFGMFHNTLFSQNSYHLLTLCHGRVSSIIRKQLECPRFVFEWSIFGHMKPLFVFTLLFLFRIVTLSHRLSITMTLRNCTLERLWDMARQGSFASKIRLFFSEQETFFTHMPSLSRRCSEMWCDWILSQRS